MTEVVLPRRAARQPVPPLVEGGDCGACALAGVLELDVAAVYDRLNRDGRKAMSWFCLRQALHNALAQGLLTALIDDVPTWTKFDAQAQWGTPGWMQNLPWGRYLRMALQAGYYGFASVVHAGTGPLVEPDHWVLLVGYRERREPFDGGTVIVPDLLVSDSSTTHEPLAWIGVVDFLQRWGGYNMLLARPAGGWP